MDGMDQVSISRWHDPIGDQACARLLAAGKIRRQRAAAAGFAPVVAPEVEARIVARRIAGERASSIGRDLKMTPREVHTVLRAHEHDGGTVPMAT
jgi:hypothetical protein